MLTQFALIATTQPICLSPLIHSKRKRRRRIPLLPPLARLVYGTSSLPPKILGFVIRVRFEEAVTTQPCLSVLRFPRNLRARVMIIHPRDPVVKCFYAVWASRGGKKRLDRSCGSYDVPDRLLGRRFGLRRTEPGSARTHGICEERGWPTSLSCWSTTAELAYRTDLFSSSDDS
jgi:hypothetical protein